MVYHTLEVIWCLGVKVENQGELSLGVEYVILGGQFQGLGG